MNRKASNADTLRRIRTYPSTPKHFDPNKASPKELMQYGLPRRPDPEKEPELARIWKRVFTRPVRFVEAKLAVDPVMSARHPGHGTGVVDKFGPNGWAGVVKMMLVEKGSDFTNPAMMVFGQWQLPDVVAITPNKGPLVVAFWVGLDGFEGLSSPADLQVAQAGVTAQVNPGFWPWSSPTVHWWPWIEWNSYIGFAVQLLNVPVAAGDEIFVLLGVRHGEEDPDGTILDFGIVSMLNITRGIGTNIGLFAPNNDIVSQGLSAEWIVEVPQESAGMPIFSPVTFTDCTAGSLQHGIFNLTNGILEDIFFPIGSLSPSDRYTQTSIASSTVAVVEELKIDWF